MNAPVTTLYAALLGLLYAGLGLRVPVLRMKFRVGIGTGGNDKLARAVRVHGNAGEYIPVFLILLLLAEFAMFPPWALHLAGITFLSARLLHAFGLGRHAGTSTGRFAGAATTFVVLIALAIALLFHLLA